MRTRKPNRFKNYDYSCPGYYFVTICVYKMQSVFGIIENEKIKLNNYGRIVERNLNQIPNIFKEIEIDEFIIMPNHVHGVIIIDVVDANFASTTDRTKMLLSKVIQQYKRSCTIEIKKNGLFDFKWQRSFYERIIRNENELLNIRKYIRNNPLNWSLNETIIENLIL